MSDKRLTDEEYKMRRNQITKMPWWTLEELKDVRVHPWGKPKACNRENLRVHDSELTIKMMISSSL
jgi:hypothetical protein